MARATKINRLLIKQVFSMFLKRRADSYKGQHGRVMIIGGSEDYFGAPVLAAQAALHSGADLVYIIVPDCIYDAVCAAAGPNFIVRKYTGTDFNDAGISVAQSLVDQVDVVIMGPGMRIVPSMLKACKQFALSLSIPLIADAGALESLRDPKCGIINTKNQLVITPHRTEFKNIFCTTIPESGTEFVNTLITAAQKSDSYIVLKGQKDFVISPQGHIFINTTGNPGMTVGGTGDVLTGIIGSFMAQHLDILSSCNCATFVSGATGDVLFKHFKYFFTAEQVARTIPHTLKKLL